MFAQSEWDFLLHFFTLKLQSKSTEKKNGAKNVTFRLIEAKNIAKIERAQKNMFAANKYSSNEQKRLRILK